MRVVREIPLVQPAADAYVTIGVFDGVHRGHQRLVREMTKAAHAAGRLAMAYTFDPHPLAVLGREPPPLLTTVEERAELMAALDLDVLVVPRFTLHTAHTTAADFTADLVQYLRMVELWAGPDFALGYRREGDVAFLRDLGATQGFALRVVAPLICEGTRVSSSRVRAALAVGDVTWAAQCLGRPYRLSGLTGHQGTVGGTARTPSVMFSPVPRRVIPAAGVYACLATFSPHAGCSAVTYISADVAGVECSATIEVCLIGWTQGVRGQDVNLDFVARLRDMDGSGSSDQLATQVRNDIARAQAVLIEARSGGEMLGCLPQALDLE